LREAKERWRALCERAVNEKDPDKFVAVIEDLIQELESLEQEMKRRDGLQRSQPREF
jgi:hypothetical protein